MKRYFLAGVLLLSGLLLAPACQADNDQDIARHAVQTGEILPLNQVVAAVRQAYPGEVLSVELERKESLWVYDIKILQDNGLIRKLRYNARTAELLKSKTKPRGQGKGHGRPFGPWEGS